MKKIIVFLYLCVLSTLESAAQTIVSEPVPFFFDLTSNEIWSFSQDNDGFLWTATSDGIARWDGHRLKTIRNDGLHPRMLSSNQTTCVRDGGLYLWVSSRHGITLIDKKTNQTLLPEDDDVLKTINIENILTTDSVVWLQSTENFVFKCSIDGKKMKQLMSTVSIPTSAEHCGLYLDVLDLQNIIHLKTVLKRLHYQSLQICS